MQELKKYSYYGNKRNCVEDAVWLSAGTYYIKITTGWYWTQKSYQLSVNTAPSTPKLGRVTSVAYNKLKISWNAVSGADGYDIFRKESGIWKYIGETEGTSYIHISSSSHPIITGTSYQYTVRAYRKLGTKYVNGGYSSTGITGKAVPAQTTISQISSSSKGLNLKWKKVSGATGYVIYRYDNGKWIKKGSTKELSFTDTSAKIGCTYSYRVRAYRRVNGKSIYGALSAIKSKKR